jgi:hypothetical protein
MDGSTQWTSLRCGSIALFLSLAMPLAASPINDPFDLGDDDGELNSPSPRRVEPDVESRMPDKEQLAPSKDQLLDPLVRELLEHGKKLAEVRVHVVEIDEEAGTITEREYTMILSRPRPHLAKVAESDDYPPSRIQAKARSRDLKNELKF